VDYLTINYYWILNIFSTSLFFSVLAALVFWETTFTLESHPSPLEDEAREGKPAIDSKPQIRVRNPPGGKSSIVF